MKKITFILALFYTNIVFADVVTGELKTSATLNSTCSISATSANFGEWRPDAPRAYSNISSQMTTNVVTVLCTNKTPFTIKGMPLGVKPNSIGRYMVGATSTDELVYNVYTSPNFEAGTWFGDGSTYPNGKTYFYNSVGTGEIQKIPFYFTVYPADVYPKKWVRPDTYTDNYTMTLVY